MKAIDFTNNSTFLYLIVRSCTKMLGKMKKKMMKQIQLQMKNWTCKSWKVNFSSGVLDICNQQGSFGYLGLIISFVNMFTEKFTLNPLLVGGYFPVSCS